MNKIIALNWKNTQTPETAGTLIKTVEDIVNIYPDYDWIVFPGDDLTLSFPRRGEVPGFGTSSKSRPEIVDKIQFGLQKVHPESTLPYCLIGHMSQRLDGRTNDEIQSELESVIDTNITPFLCVGPIHEENTLEEVMREQLVVLANWPKDRKIIIAYEPGFAVGTGKTMTLEDIEIVIDILREALKDFTHVSIIYGGSVNDNNIAGILRITDGVIIGIASQKSSSLLALSIALGQE